MAGLLYKDFTALRGKRYLWIITVIGVLFLILRFLFPGADSFETDNGDYYLWTIPWLMMTVQFSFLFEFTKKLASNDGRKKTRDFINAMPLERNAFAASKFIMFAAVCYVFLSVNIIFTEIYMGRAGSNVLTELVKTSGQFAILFACMFLLLGGIELCLFLTLGTKKAMMILTGVLELLFLLAIAYLFFGDLEKLSFIDIEKIVKWTSKNEFKLNVATALMPVIASAVYYLLYCITRKAGAEVINDG